MNYQKVVVIGAPRSGTNMLRDVLTALPNVGTWPCDEINYIWRHGNIRYPSDEFTVGMATPSVSRYIHRQFDKLAHRNQLEYVVEKTCANSLRIGFVDRVLPEAKFIVIRRDGIDAVGSAMKRWTAKLDVPYLLHKVRFVPGMDLPYYGSRYFLNRLYRLVSREKRLAFWGPQLDGIADLLVRYSLEEVCALQWKRCVDATDKALSQISSERFTEAKYEEFVLDPVQELLRVTSSLGLAVTEGACRAAISKVSARSVGKGRRDLSEETAERILPLIEDTMRRHDYV